MAFHNMPDLGAMLLPGAAKYAETLLDMARSAAGSVGHAFDIAYGPDPFQQLDIWLPAGAPAGPLPVLVMIHGGVYRNGHKEWMGAHAAEVTALPRHPGIAQLPPDPARARARLRRRLLRRAGVGLPQHRRLWRRP